MSNNLADICSNDNFCQLVLEASALGGNLYQPQPRTPNATLDRLFLSLKYKNKGSAFVAAETHPIIMVDEASGWLTNELCWEGLSKVWASGGQRRPPLAQTL